MVLLDERDGIVIGGGEMADIEVDAVVLAVRHQGVVAFESRGLVRVVGGIVAVVADHELVFVCQGRNALGHGERGACGNTFDAKAFGHGEPVLNVIVLHAVLHVVTEQGEIDTGVVEFLGDAFPGSGAGGSAPVFHFGLRGFAFGDLLRGGLRAWCAGRGPGTSRPLERRHGGGTG